MEKEEETIQQTIGKFIHFERKKQKLSLAKLSMKSHGNINYATRINNIEKGLSKDCTVHTVNLILKALGFNLAQIFKIKEK